MKACIFFILFICNVFAYSKTIYVGVFAFAPPFSTTSDNGKSYYGFHIDLMNNLCERLDLKCIYKTTTMNNQIALLDNGTIDIAFSAAPILSTNTGNYIYSLPYMNSDAQFVGLNENNNINTLEDIKDKRIGVLSNTLYHAFNLSSRSYNGDIKQYKIFPDLVSALSNNDVDVIIINKNLAYYLLLNDANKFKLVGPNIPLGEGYGLIALNKNRELVKRINSALLDMEADGSYLTIYKNYFGN